ncbi:MAG: class 1 fructose-bisphosphatase [Spirosomataceae bacterium]|jgi:fructose-1,6-bisphosphatase I|nr:class 1 fructose-bisphosphatase [Bacteroidota bacterium]
MYTPDEEKIAVPVGTTLDRFIKQHQQAFPHASGELSQLLRDIALAAKVVNREINRAGLVDIIGGFGSANVQGENQQKLDVIADIRFIRALKNGGEVAAIVSEEKENIIFTGNDHGKYVVAIDPLDGSSNIDVNVSIGTIFSIYRRITPVGSQPTIEDFLQGGRKQAAAGYILYGSSTILVFATGHGVNAFTYEHSLGEFFLSHKNMQIPLTGNIYSCNEGNYYEFPEYVQKYITNCKSKRYAARYIGSLVGDFHRNLLKGGVYLYPPTKKTPVGKLRLLYECYPLAYLIEQAGGQAFSDIDRDILDIKPTDVHQRSPLYIGSTEMLDDLHHEMRNE